MPSGLETLTVDELRAKVDRVGEALMPFVHQMSEDVGQPVDEVARMLLIAFARRRDSTARPDTITLVIQGDVIVYESALHALVAGTVEAE